MSTTFDDVMAFHPGNQDVYEEIRDNLGQLLPFVGAGLTAPVYGGWASAIEALGKGIASADTKRKLKALAKTDPLEAAQFLEEQIGEVGLRYRIVHHFSRDKLMDNWDSIRDGAIWLLPELFPRPVLTTNFDQALEMVYGERGFAGFEVLDPTSQDLRRQATRLLREPCVFKLHGTVAGTMLDYSSLVFTRDQYNVHYAPGSPVRQALAHFMRMRAALFLGCSLEGDRTVEVIREAAGPGAVHFAIASCKRAGRDFRTRELADARIRAILYKDREYDSVRVVLQQLLDDTGRS